MKVKKSILLFFLYAIVIFWPDYFFFRGINYLENILAAYSIVFIFNNKKKLSFFSAVTMLYFASILLSTFLQGGGNIHTLVSNVKIMLFVMVTDIEIEKDDYDTINVMWLLVFVFSMINFISLILFPQGVYQVETLWNEWGTISSSPYWIFGYKNSHAFWYLLLELLTVLKWHLNPTSKNKLLTYISIAVAITAQLLVASSTATVACVLGAVGAFYSVSFKAGNNRNRQINSYWIVALNFIINGMMIFGMTRFLGPIIQSLFNKDLTFSNRTNAWAIAFSSFLEKPVFGTGILSADETRKILGSLSYMHAHNEWLQCLWQGGILLFGIVILMLLLIAKQNNEIQNSKLKKMSDIFLMAVFVEMAFEVWLGSHLTWMMLLVIYRIGGLERLSIINRTRDRQRRIGRSE